MSSRSVPGAGVAVVGCGVLINAGSGNGDGGGGGVVGGGGVARGAGAAAAVRGRTLPRTGQRASQDARITVAREATSTTGNRYLIRAPGSFRFTAPSEYRSCPRKTPGVRPEDQDKENAKQPGGGGGGVTWRYPKRLRDKEGDGPNGDARRAEDRLHPPRVTALRMSKNVGESRIPLPGSIRPSFLPKPRVVKQHKLAGFDCPATPHNGGQCGMVKSLVESLANKCWDPVTSTPFVDNKVNKLSFPFSPFDCVSCDDVGKTVCVGDEKIGILRYYGALEGEVGAWCGIELPEPDGLNDGTVRGLKYFSCPENHGIMAPAAKVRRISRGSSTTSNSDCSITPIPKTTEFQVNETMNVPKNNTFLSSGQGETEVGNLICLLPESAIPGAPVANSTFVQGASARPDVTFDQGGDWKFCLKSTPNTSPDATNHLSGETNEKPTNENRVLDDKNKRNSSLNEGGQQQIETETAKIPLPTTRAKTVPGSRLVSPTIFGKPSSPSGNVANLTTTVTKAKVTPQDAVKATSPKLQTTSTISRKNGTSPTSSEARKSPVKGGELGDCLNGEKHGDQTANDNESITKSPTTTMTKVAKTEDLSMNSSDHQPINVTVNLNKTPIMNATVDINAVPKPTGAIFTLNESFINEKPLNGNAPPVLTNILYGDKSPVVEIPFARRRTYLCGQTSPQGVPQMNTTFDKPGVAAGLGSEIAKLSREIPSVKGLEDTFLIGDKAGSGQATFIEERGAGIDRKNDTFNVEGKSNNAKILDGTYLFSRKEELVKPVDATFELPRAHQQNDDTFLINSINRRSYVISGSLVLVEEQPVVTDPVVPSDTQDSTVLSQIDAVGDSCLIDVSNSTVNDTANFSHNRNAANRYSMDRFGTRNLQDSKISLLDDVGDSCLVDSISNNETYYLEDCHDNTMKASIGLNMNPKIGSKIGNSCLEPVSGPYSLLGLNGPEEEDELTPPAAPPPSKATPAPHYLMLNKQNSFEHDESLGILTPDQMAEFSMALECSRTPSCENLTGSAGSRIAMTRASASRPSDLPTSVDGELPEGSSERTPSPEDLPLDPKPAEPPRTVPVSFITSVTSITSLEAGYQGDGENSRPASRGSDPAPVAPPPNLPAPRTDPMTDSDFFTESDADAHEEIGRGDRRAQVIDGTLFCAPGGRRCPSFTGEEMDSSGIYSDLDRRQDDQPHEEAPDTPDTADTESQKSQPSPHQDALQHQQAQQQQQPVVFDCLQIPSNSLDISVDSNTSVGTMEVTVIEVANLQAPAAKMSNKSDPVPLKKYKMPKRNVVSKIKAMIESGPKDESEKESRRPQRTPRKGGRWDAVMSKIEAGKNEQRSRPVRKEVKSRVLQSLGPPPSATSRRSPGDSSKSKSRRTRGRQDVVSPTQETAQSSVHSSMSDISSAPRSAKKRLASPGGSEGSAQSTPRVSSPRQTQPPSTLTIVNNANVNNNNNNNNNTVAINNGTSNSNSNNNNVNINQQQNSARPIPSHSQRSPTAGNPQRRTVNGRPSQQTRISNSEAKKNSLDISRVNLEKSPSAARKPAVPRRSSSNVAPKTQSVSPPAKDRGPKETTTTITTPVPRGNVETREQAHQTDPTNEELKLKQAEVSVQALTVIVQYLAHQLDGFSAPRLKKESEQHDVRQRALDQLRNELESRHANRLAELETALQEEREKCEARLQDTLTSSTKELQVTIARLRTEHEADLVRKEAETDRRSAVHDQGAALRAEAESLRTVLELRSQEIASLRAENENLRREVEVKEALEAKVVALEARSEDLRAQLQRKETFERQLSHENKVLLESFHQESKQNKRLSQHNEELQWRLRQNNEVVTVLANQLATPPQRLTRSLGPEQTSPEDSPPASPMVKSMVEKSDSVSWTLEIEETPEAMASRLLRRSGSSRGISPSDSRPKRARQPSTSSSSTTATVSRQSSLRASGPQRAVVLRARSKSVSVADAVPQESWAPPGFSSTPVVRRRPRSDPAGSPVGVQETNPGLRPQEAGGEAMISEETSASSSEDESSASSDIPRLAMELSWSESEG